VEQALLAVEGVQGASVDLATKTAVVEHGDTVDHETLRGAVDAAGYSVDPVA
jgi:copper chaperone CopZ